MHETGSTMLTSEMQMLKNRSENRDKGGKKIFSLTLLSMLRRVFNDLFNTNRRQLVIKQRRKIFRTRKHLDTNVRKFSIFPVMNSQKIGSNLPSHKEMLEVYIDWIHGINI